MGKSPNGSSSTLLVSLTLVALVACDSDTAPESARGSRTEHFDVEPAWTAVNTEPDVPACIPIDQDLGTLADSNVAGGSLGETVAR